MKAPPQGAKRAMFPCRFFIFASALVVLATSSQETNSSVTPVQKVITLLEDLETQVKSEGTAEAATYDTFACFCKDSTASKSSSITTGQDKIDSLSATIQEDTASQASKVSEVEERKVKLDELGAELKSTTARCLKESAEFEAKVADLTKAVSSLDGAITALSSSKPSLISVRKTVDNSLALAEAMSLTAAPKLQAIHAFLQQSVDPVDPAYQFHSQGVVDTLTQLRSDFDSAKTDAVSEWEKSNKACADLKKSLSDDMSAHDSAIKKLEEEINDLKKAIAINRGDLVSSEAMLQDDQAYLKDVTLRCESRAKEWDQRSQLRAGELEALAKALAVLKDKVQGLDVAVNKRALMQSKVHIAIGANRTVVTSNKTTRTFRSAVSSQHAASAPAAKSAVPVKVAKHVSFIQGDSTFSSRLRSVARRKKEELARSVLSKEGARLHSPTLAALAERVAADPFSKVKTLIQQLIERLLNEATQEATKKGFCDTELGKAKQDRDFRWAEVQKLSAEYSTLAAKKDELDEAIADAEESANSTSTELAAATSERSVSKKLNIDTVAKAKEGLAAVTEAISILKTFYKQAAKGKVLLQASPVEEDDPGAGFEGVYAGQQESSAGILGLLETIRSDFERTARVTASEEKKAAEDFVDFDRASKASISEQLKGKELNGQELESTENAIVQTKNEIDSTQSMLDSALKAIEDLKPMCIDNVMTFAERTQKREEEIQALKMALCYLDPNKVETECQ